MLAPFCWSCARDKVAIFDFNINGQCVQCMVDWVKRDQTLKRLNRINAINVKCLVAPSRCYTEQCHFVTGNRMCSTLNIAIYTSIFSNFGINCWSRLEPAPTKKFLILISSWRFRFIVASQSNIINKFLWIILVWHLRTCTLGIACAMCNTVRFCRLSFMNRSMSFKRTQDYRPKQNIENSMSQSWCMFRDPEMPCVSN